jgi:DNA-binding transcriptional LysR family regulator
VKQLQSSLPGLISAVQAADSGGFSAAATVLNLTPAAVSKNVATLEAILGIRLFNRTTRQLSLTEEGRAFIAQTRQGLTLLERAATQATQGLKPQGLVRLNCPVGFGRRYVLPLLPAFYANNPLVQVELNLNDHAVDLVKEGFDIGIRGGSLPPEGMVARKICDVHSALLASPQYLTKKGTPKTFKDLGAHDLLKVKFLNGRVTPWAFKSKTNGKEQQEIFEGGAVLFLSDPEVITDAALLHMGIARMGLHHAFEHIQSGALVPVLQDQHISTKASMSVFYPHRAGLAPRVRVLLDHLISGFSKEPSLQASKADFKTEKVRRLR